MGTDTVMTNSSILGEVANAMSGVLSLATGAVSDAVFSPDGSRLYSASGNIVTSFDRQTGQVLGSWQVGSSLGAMDITPDGSRLVLTEQTPIAQQTVNYVTTTTIGVHVLDLVSGTISTYTTVAGYYEGPFYDVAVLANGVAVLSQDFYGSGHPPLTTFDLATGSLTRAANSAGGQAHVLTRTHDYSRALAAAQNISDAPLIALNASGQPTAYHGLYADNVFGFNRGVQAISNSYIAQFGIHIYDTSLKYQSNLQSRYPELTTAIGLAFDPTGSQLYLLDTRSDTVFALSTSTFDVVAGYAIGTDIGDFGSTKFGDRVAVSPDGTHLSIIGDAEIQLIDLALIQPVGSTSGDDTITGSVGNSVLYGFSGNDVFVDASGDDELYGGTGDDTYYVNSPGDVVIENQGQGFDRLITSVTTTIPLNVEEIVAAEGYLPSLYGTINSFERLIGNSGDNYLNGKGGGDTLIGGDGSDTYDEVSQSDFIVETVGGGARDTLLVKGSYALAAGSEIEVLSAQNVLTSVPVAYLIGNEFANEIVGNNGANILNGGGGADLLIGRGGNDIYYVDSAGDVVIEGAGQGSRDLVYTRGDFTLFAGQEVELLSADWNAGTAHLTLVGNELANEIVGNDGINEFFGGGGADRLVGLGGDDIYHVDGPEDLVFEGPGQGARDLVYAPGSYALLSGQQIEVLSPDWNGGTAPMNMTGNEFANEIYGNDGINVLRGGGGLDRLVGLGGNDIYYVDNDDLVFEAAGGGARDLVYAPGSYTLFAGQEIEVLSPDWNGGTAPLDMTGNEFANEIYGNNGVNTLRGGGGADQLIGLGGNDIYYVDNDDVVFESVGAGARDLVYAPGSYTLQPGQEIEVLSPDWNGGTAALDLTGNEFANEIYGNDGANVIDGRGGADKLIGLNGADSYAFTTALGGGNIDTIFGFAAGDRILLAAGVFAGLTPGALSAAAFQTSPTALEADDRILYDQTAGTLAFDPDGTGSAAATVFVAFSGAGPNLAAADFAVI